MTDEPSRPEAPRLQPAAPETADDVEQLRIAERRYQDLLEEAPLAYLATDSTGQLASINRRAVEDLGCPAEQLLGRPLLALFVEPARVEEELHRLRAGDPATSLEVEVRRPDGQPLGVQLWLKRLPDSSVRCLWLDISARVAAEAERTRLAQENLYLREEIQAEHNFEEIIGQGPAIRAMLDKVRLVAGTDTTVLVLGEPGAGKELIVRAVHAASKRKDRPLIKVNCAALPTGQIESELFGHEQAAPPQPVSRLELAEGGTLFLDEVGAVPLEIQTRLLRVLQEREFERIGGSKAIKVDVRIIAATNRDLKKAMREKTFREDFYYRLSVFPIQVPPLRDRREDLPLLTQFLVSRLANRVGKRIESVTDETQQRLAAYPWPGNVRELASVLERAILRCSGAVLDIPPELLTTSGTLMAPPSPPLPLDLATLERNHIATVLERTRWVIDGPHGAARVLGLHPNTLRSRLKKLGIQRPPHESS